MRQKITFTAMKTKFLFLTLALSCLFIHSSGQVPQGFNYQAVARDESGYSLQNQSLQVMLYIQSEPTGGTTFWKELHNPVSTNDFGLLTVVVGKGVRQAASTVATFDEIDWKVTPKYIKTEIYYSGSWKDMGDGVQLYSVPYAMAAKELAGADKLNIKGTATNPDTALFEVRNKSGQTIFAVYSEGVRMWVSDGNRGTKGGFAVGGFDQRQEYFRVTSDSTRIYVNNNPAKGQKGGFAVGGFDDIKGVTEALSTSPRPENYLTSIHDALLLEPRSDPPNPAKEGMMYFDSDDKKLKVFDGTQWRSLW
jgi:hypothetical protein